MIDFGAGPGTRPADTATTMEFVGGPRAGERETRMDPPLRVPAVGGSYRRSVRCADDSALRYVWDGDLVQSTVDHI